MATKPEPTPTPTPTAAPNLKPIFNKFAERMAADLLALQKVLAAGGGNQPACDQIGLMMAKCLQFKEELESASRE